MVINEFKDKAKSLADNIVKKTNCFTYQSGRSQKTSFSSDLFQKQNSFNIRKIDIFQNNDGDCIEGARKNQKINVNYIENSQNIFERIKPNDDISPLLTFKEHLSIILTFDSKTGESEFFFIKFPEICLKEKYSFENQKINKVKGDDAIIRVSKILKNVEGNLDFNNISRILIENVEPIENTFDDIKENINLKLSLAKDAILGKKIIVDSVLEDKTVIENNKKIEQLENEIKKIKALTVEKIKSIDGTLVSNNYFNGGSIDRIKTVDDLMRELNDSSYFPFLDSQGFKDVLNEAKSLGLVNKQNISGMRELFLKIT